MRNLRHVLLSTTLLATLAGTAGIASAAGAGTRTADPYLDGARTGARDIYTDGARAVNDQRSPFTDGARSVHDQRDPFTRGA